MTRHERQRVAGIFKRWLAERAVRHHLEEEKALRQCAERRFEVLASQLSAIELFSGNATVSDSVACFFLLGDQDSESRMILREFNMTWASLQSDSRMATPVTTYLAMDWSLSATIPDKTLLKLDHAFLRRIKASARTRPRACVDLLSFAENKMFALRQDSLVNPSTSLNIFAVCFELTHALRNVTSTTMASLPRVDHFKACLGILRAVECFLRQRLVYLNAQADTTMRQYQKFILPHEPQSFLLQALRAWIERALAPSDAEASKTLGEHLLSICGQNVHVLNATRTAVDDGEGRLVLIDKSVGVDSSEQISLHWSWDFRDRTQYDLHEVVWEFVEQRAFAMPSLKVDAFTCEDEFYQFLMAGDISGVMTEFEETFRE